MLLLIVEDDRGIAKLIAEKMHGAGFAAASVYSGAEALAWLSRQAPDMVVLDYTLPDMTAEQLLDALEERGIPLPPFIVATGRGDEQIAVDMMKRGARDYIVKDGIFLEMLPAAVQRVCREIQSEIDCAQAEAARQLLERQLQHAQKLESLGILAGGIAHDFNNLLMVILGNAELALSALPSASSVCGNIQAIETAAHRATDLVRQMLDYAGESLFVFEPIDAAALIRQLTPLLRERIPASVVFTVACEPDVPVFTADASQIRRIIIRLIANAVEAIAEHTGTIVLAAGAMHCGRVYFESCSEIARAAAGRFFEGQYVYFEVADTGCGMDAATVEKVFDPFFSTKFTGRGLGMSAVLGSVRGHNGLIKIDSQPGNGTTVRLLFPVKRVSANGSAPDGHP